MLLAEFALELRRLQQQVWQRSDVGFKGHRQQQTGGSVLQGVPARLLGQSMLVGTGPYWHTRHHHEQQAANLGSTKKTATSINACGCGAQVGT
jgi:hypothetical protein